MHINSIAVRLYPRPQVKLAINVSRGGGTVYMTGPGKSVSSATKLKLLHLQDLDLFIFCLWLDITGR